MTLPQVRGMYNGDHARKSTLVEYGFRLPSALDNRPLTFDEFETHIRRAVYVSATPGKYYPLYTSDAADEEDCVDLVLRTLMIEQITLDAKRVSPLN